MNRYILFGRLPYALGILRPLQEAIRRRGDDAAWLLPGELQRRLLPDEKLLRSVDEAFAFNPTAVFVPGNIAPFFLPGLKVQVFHGFGIEKKGHFRIRGFYDLYCTHGPATTVPFQKLAEKHGHFSVAETGWPKLDPLFTRDATVSQRGGEQVILYAPTFSPSLTSADLLKDEIIRLSSAGCSRWIVKFHDKMDPGTVAAYRAAASPNLVVADNDNIVPLMQGADVMLSDTSSVIAEFLLMRKPVVTFRNREPGPHLLNIEDPVQLGESLSRAMSCPEELMRAGAAFADAMHPYRDGLSSDRILTAVESFLADPPQLRNKPLNLLRKFKVRRTLNYWGPAAPSTR